MRASLRVEVVYALAGRQDIVRLRLEEGATVGDAVEASGLADANLRVGIGGRQVNAGRILRDGDRVELLRPLAAHPREARRARARRRAPRIRV
jgi:putative ubiquitin-RnfH superfamily antitoxin RatB of RatAB toxin-antitoxin module